MRCEGVSFNQFQLMGADVDGDPLTFTITSVGFRV
jgi:hypothetical protein